MDPDVLKIAEIVAIFVTALTVLSVVTHRVKARFLRDKQQSLLASAPINVDDSRFERLERAVDAIAVEVERMTEAQRFNAKLMLERAPDKTRGGESASEESR